MDNKTTETIDDSLSKNQNQHHSPHIDKGVGDVVDESYVANEKSLVRKLDMTLMPIVFILYLLNYLDRNNIAYVVDGHLSTVRSLIPATKVKQNSIHLTKTWGSKTTSTILQSLS